MQLVVESYDLTLGGRSDDTYQITFRRPRPGEIANAALTLGSDGIAPDLRWLMQPSSEPAKAG
jgi:hypothetical protein